MDLAKHGAGTLYPQDMQIYQRETTVINELFAFLPHNYCVFMLKTSLISLNSMYENSWERDEAPLRALGEE